MDRVCLLVVTLWRDSDGVKARLSTTFDLARPPSVRVIAGFEALRASLELWIADAETRLQPDGEPPAGATNA
jgi:hypothetical protein